MSFYSGGEVKTKILDPVNDIPNVRSEFRLDDLGAFMSNMKLINVGCKVATAAVNYAHLVGAYGVIKNISLRDGNVELSACRDANLVLGFKNFNMSNSENESLNSIVSKSEQGYFEDSYSGESGESRKARNAVKTTDDEKTLGHLELRQILPLLNSLRSMDNLRFKRLRLVVEYQNKKRVVLDDDTNSFTTSRPSLVVDVIEDEGVRNSELQNTPSSINWIELEKDSFIIPAVAVSAGNTHVVQSTTLKINAFNNKTLSRVLVQKQFSNSDFYFSGQDVIGMGPTGSLGLYLQKTQYRVNGSNLLSGSGVEGNNQRQALLVDTWGDCNQTLGGNILGSHTETFTNDGLNRQGGTDFEGIFVGKPVRDFQILVERKGIYDNGNQAQDLNELIVNVFGEVNKNIQIKGDEYKISYN